MSVRIGIEIEFMVAFPGIDKMRSKADRQDTRWPEGEPATNANDFMGRDFANNECLYKVCSVLAGLGLPVACSHSFDTALQHNITEKHGGEVKSLDGKLCRVWNPEMAMGEVECERFRYWFVSHESYITAKLMDNPVPYTPEGYNWYAVEISTPVISDDVEFDCGLPMVCGALEGLRNKMKIFVNEECGLHIHASPGNGVLSHEVARGVASLTFLIENPVLYKACHGFRSTSAFCQPITEASQLGKGDYGYTLEDTFSATCVSAIREARQEVPKKIPNELEVFQMIRNVLAQSTLKTLYNGLRNKADGKMGMTMSSFGTIEFRYPEGSFDIDFIWFWVSLVRQLFKLAMLPPSVFAERLAALFRLAVCPDRVESHKWLEVLGLEVRASYFHSRQELYKAGHSLNKGGILPPGRR